MSHEAAWEALAEHFLDTETRTWIPHTALTCIEADLDRRGAFEVWAYEVTPALWPNIWDVAGEWAGWNRDWLIARIRRKRVPPSRWGYPWYRWRINGLHAQWRAIGACMDVLLPLAATERAELAAELTWLARQFFDFMACGPAPTSAARLRAVYEHTFPPIFAPLVVSGSRGESRSACAERVASRLAQLSSARAL